MKRPPTDRARGFTLIETLVAFVLLSSVLAVLMQNLSLGMRNQRASLHYLEAVQLAESLLAEVPWVSAETPRETFGPEQDPLVWSITITPYQPGDGSVTSNLALFEVAVTVRWRQRAGFSEFTLSSLRTGAVPGV